MGFFLYLCTQNRIYMILYFSATGNSLAVARLLAERLNEQLMLLTEAVQQDWTAEKRIGLVFPTYDFNLPPALPDMISRLKISPQSCNKPSARMVNRHARIVNTVILKSNRKTCCLDRELNKPTHI